jgi:glycine/D-amino acid oxidase-like deaminating enzyme
MTHLHNASWLALFFVVFLSPRPAAATPVPDVAVDERTPVTAVERDATGVVARTPHGRVRARRAILATSAFPPLVRAIRRYVVPVYDYVLVTEPLTAAQRASVGWARRQGLSDVTNQFHYYRLTPDDRILWGGYDAVYHFRNGIGPHLDQRPATHAMLAQQFFETFPQLEGLRFSHRWGGAIDTCSRFCVTFGRALGGRAAYAVGFTGLGVGASRFGARVALDLVDQRETERTRLRMVREKPLPFPPEPLRFAGIELTRRELARADRNQGRRGLWLRALDRVGLGFDS